MSQEKLNNLIKRAFVFKKQKQYGQAIKLYRRIFKILCGLAGKYAESKKGTQLEFINKKYDLGKNKYYKNYIADEWCAVFEADKELFAFDQKFFALMKKWLIKDGKAYLVCRELGSIYKKINDFKKARSWFAKANNFK